MTSERTLQSVGDSLGERGDKTALLAFEKKDRHRWSFEKLASCARSFANGLVEQDFKRGDTVALFAENSSEWIAAALGIIRASMVAVPLDVQLGDETLVHTLQDSDTRAIITTRKRAKRIEKLDLKNKPKFILLDADSGDERSWEQFLSNEATDLPTTSSDDKAVLFYTSGGTGRVAARRREKRATDPWWRPYLALAAASSRLSICHRHAGSTRSRFAVGSAIFA